MISTLHRLAIVYILLTSGHIYASTDFIAHQITIPLYDSPENTNLDFRNPTMNQSLLISKSFYQFSHYSLQKFWPAESTGALISIIAFDTLSTWLPLSNARLHEEWHRAVLNQYDISSYNGVYDMQFFSETISVSHLSDEDLILLKTEHPRDIVRLHSAGFEAQTQLNFHLEMDKFFHNSKSFDYMLLWFNNINSLAYFDTCSSSESNKLTAKILRHEDQDIKQRDFTGLDCNAWVYDLFRPNEPYTNRGSHPSGVGLDRYIAQQDLTSQERNFLRRQYYLYFLNFVDPFLLSKDYFDWPEFLPRKEITWNSHLQHYITPFGYSIFWNVFLKSTDYKIKLSLKNHFNFENYFPAINAAIYERPFFLPKTKFSVDFSLWQQPKDLDFLTAQHQWGGAVATGMHFDISKYFVLYTSVNLKTAGWQEGQVSLDRSLNLQAGFLINRFE